MIRTSLLMLKTLLILIFAGWVSLWILKPTVFWTRQWKDAEEKASESMFGYNGLDFAVYTFPLIALAIIVFIYLDLKQRESRNRKIGRNSHRFFSNPIVVNQYIGILSAPQILAAAAFIIFLAWTFYIRVSNDFKKMIPIKEFKLSSWQYKLFRMATRCGLLAEACLALLLLPVLRGMSVFRLLGIQFEASVTYHIWLGTAMVLFATIHGAGTFFIWGIKHRVQDEMWKWQKKGRIYLAGELALLAALLIWITALPKIRRKWFEVFYYTHHLYILFIVFFLFHGGDRHFYMVLPGVFLFGLDKLLRIIQSRPETCILSARVFPCKAIELTLPKDPRLKYLPTSVIFLKIPSVSKLQWHPFSITSSSSIDENTMSVIIKSEGEWTKSLHDRIQAKSDAEADQRQCIPVAMEGPYEPASLQFVRYNNLLLIAGGIGITPFLSILQEIGSNLGNDRNRYNPDRIQLIYTVKKSQDICLLDPILPQLLHIKKFHIRLKVYVTRENQIDTTLREVLDNIPEIQIANFSNTCSSYTTYGIESLLWMAAITTTSSVIFLVLLVFFNHFIIQPVKKPSNQKIPSSFVDLLLMCAFVIAVTCSASIVITLRRKRLKKELHLFSDKQRKPIKQSSLESSRDLNEHEIHFGERPKFQDIFSNFKVEPEKSDVGVLVCGPEAMKEAVASACRMSCFTLERKAQHKKPNFNFHSLNFTL